MENLEITHASGCYQSTRKNHAMLLHDLAPFAIDRLSTCAAIAAILIAMLGCASPESRVKERPRLFASFPVEVQEKVRQGHVEVGFTKDMVLIAQGTPDRRVAQMDATGTVDESWIYTDVYYTHVPVDRSFYNYYRNDHCRTHHRHRHDNGYYFERAWDDIPHLYDRLILRLKGDRVVSIAYDER